VLVVAVKMETLILVVAVVVLVVMQGQLAP
jgi:hypothetical protein